jgi:hypothetical protein
MFDEDSPALLIVIIVGVLALVFFFGDCSIKVTSAERQREDAELAEWLRAKQLREMRADKAKGEQP